VLQPEVLLTGDCLVEVEHRPEEAGASPPPKVTKKRRRWLGRERAWDESRWDFYMRFWRYFARWKTMAAAVGDSEEGGDDDDDRTLVNSSDDADGGNHHAAAAAAADKDYKRRRCFEKLCGAYRTYCKRFERR
jgi:hypothetical protein